MIATRSFPRLSRMESLPPDTPDLLPTQPPLILAEGRRLFDRFTLVRQLGRGAMGIVWLAEDCVLGERIALKFLPELMAWDKLGLAELKAETARARSLSHPAIVRVFDLVSEGGTAAIAMEFVDGETLADRLARESSRVLDAGEIATWLPELAAALDYSHQDARIVHRDLKPANIMVTNQGRVKVTDFGIARTLVDSMTRASSWSTGGTLLYMSPQQQMGEPPAASDDIYALGAVLYELLAGKPPFHTGNVVAQIQGRAPDTIAGRRRQLNIAAAPVPAGCEAVVFACLEKDPAKRPKSAGEVATRFVEGLAKSGSNSRPRGLHIPKIVLAAGAAGALVLTLAVVFRRPQVPPAARPEQTRDDTGTVSMGATSNTYTASEDFELIVRQEFGPTADIADWTEIKRLSPEQANALFTEGVTSEGIAAYWIRFGGDIATPDGRSRHILIRASHTPNGFAFERSSELDLAVTHAGADSRAWILASLSKGRAELPRQIRESLKFVDEHLPGNWTRSGTAKALSGQGRFSLDANGGGGDAVLRRALPGGLQGIAVTARAGTANAVLGMRHELSFEGDGGKRWIVRVERPEGTRSVLSVSVGQSDSPALSREIAPVFGRTELRIVAADQRIRLQILSTGDGKEYFNETGVFDAFRCADVRGLQWTMSHSGGVSVWLEQLDLFAQ